MTEQIYAGIGQVVVGQHLDLQRPRARSKAHGEAIVDKRLQVEVVDITSVEVAARVKPERVTLAVG